MGLLLVKAGLWVAVFFALAVSACSDLKARIIPNRLVLLLAAAALAMGLASRPSLLWISVIAAIFILCALGFLAHFNFLGGGDAKLIAAASLLVPPDQIVRLLLAIAFAGGLLSLIYLAYFVACQALRRSRAISGQRSLIDTSHLGVVGSVPYGIAILGGVTIYVASEFHQCLSATSCSL